jgi:hypothetical protein
MAFSRPQLICFSYHKTGTSLFLHVMTKICQRLGLVLVNHYGLVERLDPLPDVVLLPHSLLRGGLDRPYRAIRLIRDPRDMWVSGYLYHLHSHEEWCRNSDMHPTSPIGWPQVDYSVIHWPEAWKRRYLERLGGKSYQQNLLDRSPADGLDFELDGYTGCTLATMREWKLNGVEALDVKLEDVMADFDATMLRVFDHFGFTAEQSEAALGVARTEDIRRMDDAAVAERPQIHSRTISKWRGVLSAAQIARFEACHGDLIRELGYELAGSAGKPSATTDDGARPLGSYPAPDERGNAPAAPGTTRDAGIRLSADGAAIRPIAAGQDTYSFVVPSGRGRVRLESRAAVPCEPGDTRRLGVKVRRIDIRSDAGEVVIPADDPGLTAGWHDAERAGTELWRWTDGSAELPWAGVSGPAVVTIHCGTLGEYPLEEETRWH